MADAFTNNLYVAQFREYGRAFWQARFLDREDLFEWDCEWTELPRAGLVELSLHCPNGDVGVLGKRSAGMGDRFFQFKGAARGGINGTLYQVVGFKIPGAHDLAQVYGWDYVNQQFKCDPITRMPLTVSIAPGEHTFGAGETDYLDFGVLGIRT